MFSSPRSLWGQTGRWAGGKELRRPPLGCIALALGLSPGAPVCKLRAVQLPSPDGYGPYLLLVQGLSWLRGGGLETADGRNRSGIANKNKNTNGRQHLLSTYDARPDAYVNSPVGGDIWLVPLKNTERLGYLFRVTEPIKSVKSWVQNCSREEALSGSSLPVHLAHSDGSQKIE